MLARAAAMRATESSVWRVADDELEPGCGGPDADWLLERLCRVGPEELCWVE